MAKRNDRKNVREEETVTNYYALNTDAVDRLVNASKETAPERKKDDPDPYKSGFLSKIPSWVKALFIKYWFVGAACFFFLWGLGIFIEDYLTLNVILALAIGVFTDLLINNALRFMQTSDRELDSFMLLPMKRFWTFFVNIIYAVIVVLLVVQTYNGINMLAIKVKNLPEESVFLGVEPFLFALFYLIYDMIFIGIKDGIVYLVKHKKVRY